MTLEDKLILQFENKKLQDEFKMLEVIEGLPNVHTEKIVNVLRDKYALKIK